MLLAQLQEVGIQLSKDQLAVLADTRERIDFGPDALAEVHNPDNMANSMINQDVQYVKETQQAVVRNLNSFAQQDALILSMIEQLKTQEKVLEITALKDELRKLKGKALVDNVVIKHTIDLEMLKNNVEPITPKLLNNRIAHSAYIKHTEEEAAVLKDQFRTWFLNLLSANKKEPSQSWGSIVSDVPSSSLDECSKKKPHKPKSKDTNQEKLYLLHMDLCGQMRVASVNGKKYILVIVDDYSRFTWVKCLRSKDEDPDFIIKFLKMILLRLKVPVRRIKTDNRTEFVNQTLREYYEKVGISHETSVARSPQQNGVVERRNRTLIEAACTMLIYAKAPLFLWAEAVATTCYTQNHSIIRLHHGKTPYDLLHDKLPDLSFFHVFGALCYPKNDSENLDFDELTALASKHSSSGLALHEMTPATISSGLVPNPPPSTPFVPPSRIAPVPAVSTGSPSSTTVDQDAPSPNKS
ncbi:retrovirus-related pol polyprotein from transposon TNT 1-94, partial [Tanacetum coccineum]